MPATEARELARTVTDTYDIYRTIDDDPAFDKSPKEADFLRFEPSEERKEKEVFLDCETDPTTGSPTPSGSRNSLSYWVDNDGLKAVRAESISKGEVRQIFVTETENGVGIMDTRVSFGVLGDSSDLDNSHPFGHTQTWFISK